MTTTDGRTLPEEEIDDTICCACDAKNVKTGRCGYCKDDVCEECCRPDCDWSEDCEDLCCMYCWLEDAADGIPLAELVKKHRAPKPKKYILKLKGGKVVSKSPVQA